MNKKYQKRSYKALFSVLDNFYKEIKSDSVGALLGSMNPDIFCDSDSADSAAFEDFCDCLHECLTKSLIEDAKTAHAASINFLLFYKNEFGFDLDDAVAYVDYEKFEEEFGNN